MQAGTAVLRLFIGTIGMGWWGSRRMAKRFQTRHPVVFGVQLRTKDGWVDGTVFDASVGGVFVQIHNPMPQGSVVQARISLPSGDSFEALCEVRRTIRDNVVDPRGPGVGVRFISLSHEAKRVWEDSLPKKRPAAANPQPAPSTATTRARMGLQIKEIVATNVRRQRSAAIQQRRKSKQVGGQAPAARPQRHNSPPPRRAAALHRKPLKPIVDMPAQRRPSRPAPPKQAARPDPSLPPRTPLKERRPSNEQVINGPTPVTPQPPGQTTRATPSAAYSATQATFDTPDDSWLPLNYQPTSRDALRTFVDDCLMKGDALVPCAARAEPGQPFVLLITHPVTDEEMRVFGRVRAVHGEGATQVVEVGFIRTDVGGVAEVDAFVGDKDIEAQEAARRKAKRAELRKTAGANPQDPVVHIALGWFELIDSRNEKAAIDAFLEAITMDPTCVEAYHGLALAHALTGETKRALAFAASARRLAGY